MKRKTDRGYIPQISVEPANFVSLKNRRSLAAIVKRITLSPPNRYLPIPCDSLDGYQPHEANNTMHAPHSPSPSSKPSHLAKATILIATLLPSTYAANQWLYPDVHTIPTYNFLDTVNASWTSNFVAPYLLLLCHPPDDTAHYAYRRSHPQPPCPQGNFHHIILTLTVQHTTIRSRRQARPSCLSTTGRPGRATSKCRTCTTPARTHPPSTVTISTLS